MRARRNGQVRYFVGTGIGSCKKTVTVNTGDDLEAIRANAIAALAKHSFVEVGSYSRWREAKTPAEVSRALDAILGSR